MKINVIFFGSTTDSVRVIDALYQCNNVTMQQFSFSAVVTQPPRPAGRDQTITQTPVEIWAKEKNIPVLSFASHQDKPWLYADEQQVIDTLQPFKPDLLVSACYGQKISSSTIKSAKYGGLNVHPSLLPRWRGADPVPWAILAGDHQKGATVVTLADRFDEGKIVAQKKVPITNKDASDPLRTKLFELGAQLVIKMLPEYLKSKPKVQPKQLSNVTIKQFPYARRFTRQDGFIPWELLQDAM